MIALWDWNLQWGRTQIFPCDRRINNLIASPNYSSWADTDRNLLLMNLASASVWFWMARLLSGRWGVWELSSLWGLQSLILNGKWKGPICFWKCLEMQLKAQRLALSRHTSADEWTVFVCWHPLCQGHTFFLASPLLGERLTWVSLVPLQLSFWMPVFRD